MRRLLSVRAKNRSLLVMLVGVLVVAAAFAAPSVASSAMKGLATIRATAYEAVAKTFWSGTGTYASRSKIASGDVNGDGFGDVINFYRRTTTGSTVYFYRSSGASMVRSTAWSGTMAFTRTQVAAGDYDGDGRADLFLLYDRGSGIGSVYVMTSNGTSLSRPKEIYRSGRKGLVFSRARLTAGDPNNDHRAEAVILYEKGLGRASILVVGKSSVQIQGAVLNASGGGPIDGATVTLFNSSAAQLAQSASAPDGSYTLVAPAGSNYSATFTMTGFMPATYYGISAGGVVTSLEAVRLIPETASGPGNASGIVKNAFNGDPIDGLTVRLRSGINNTTGALTGLSTLTAGGGAYSFSALAGGYYTAEVSGSGFTTAFFNIISVGGQDSANQNGSITPVLTGTGIRIILDWGDAPRDVDSHLTGPISGTTRFHVYYSSKVYQSGDTTVAVLDVDDRDGFGPETITLSRTSGGVYRYSVYDFTNGSLTSSTALADSRARVRVYQGASLIATYNVPNHPGTLWKVFEMSGSTITAKNTMSYFSSGSSNIP